MRELNAVEAGGKTLYIGIVCDCSQVFELAVIDLFPVMTTRHTTLLRRIKPLVAGRCLQHHDFPDTPFSAWLPLPEGLIYRCRQSLRSSWVRYSFHYIGSILACGQEEAQQHIRKVRVSASDTASYGATN